MMEVYIDGASLGNPGRMGAGFLIYKDDKLLKKEKIYLGEGTNNFSEYMALILALLEVLSFNDREVKVYSDSNLICEQLKGRFRVKNKNIYPLYLLAKRLTSKMDNFEIFHIDRSKNREADKLAKEAAQMAL